MVEAGKTQFDLLLSGAQHAGDHVLHINGHVAQANDLCLAVAAHRFSDDPRRVGEVENKRLRRQRFHFARHLKDHRNGPQCLSESADAGSLLPQQMILQPKAFIRRARCQLADAQLG